ncbi:restriction endonuclease, partial [Streptomyces sp. NPDC005070]
APGRPWAPGPSPSGPSAISRSPTRPPGPGLRRRRDGCLDVDVVGGAGDLGADVVAMTPDGRSVVIQCKRYGDGNRVGSQDLQRFGGTCFTVHGADVAVVVTTSDFTAPALDYAEQCGIVCVDGPQLQRWQEGAGPRPWEAQPSAG